VRGLIACAFLLIFVVVCPRSAFAQARRDARLLVTVADQTGAVIPGATVKVDGQEPATRSATSEAVLTSDQGIAAIAGLVPGRYVVQAAFPGFETNFAATRVRTGDNNRRWSCRSRSSPDEITVGRDKQEAAADAR
jgi:hypothetical protein